MSGPANDILFKSDSSSSASSANSFASDVFKDVSLPATNNSGYTSNSSTNPLGAFFNDTDTPEYGPKTLFIRDMVLIEDRLLWIQDKPTYRLIFEEKYPSVVAYAFGDVKLVTNLNSPTRYQKYLLFNLPGDGVGVSGVLSRAQFILLNNHIAGGTSRVQFYADGVAGNTLDVGAANGNAYNLTDKVAAFSHSSTNETRGIHDIRAVAVDTNGALTVCGLVVYEENAGNNIDVFPGTTYVDKTKATSTTGATLALPSFGSSLGGRSVIYKTSAASYQMSSVGMTALATAAVGSSGTNSLTVTTGTGASFPAGTGIVAYFGTTAYLGSVLSVSTDTLTVGPTLTGGISGPLYKTWNSGTSLDFSSYTLTISIGASQFAEYNGVNRPDSFGRYWIWGGGATASNYYTGVPGGSYSTFYPVIAFSGNNTFFQVDGYFQAAEIEWACQDSSTGDLNYSSFINGYHGVSQPTVGFFNFQNISVVNNLGPGWNNFRIVAGPTMLGAAISRVNLYERVRDTSITSGVLAEFDTLQDYAPPLIIGASTQALGTYRRIYADQMILKPAWTRAADTNYPGGIYYSSTGTSCSLRFDYYGDHFTLLGTGGSFAITLDGASFSSVFGIAQRVATLGFHSIVGSATGTSTFFSGIDYHRTTSELTNLQNYDPVNPINGNILINQSVDGGEKIKDSSITKDKIKSRIITLDGTDPGIGGIWGSANLNGQNTASGTPVVFLVPNFTVSGKHPVKFWLDTAVGSSPCYLNLATGTTNSFGMIELNKGASILSVSRFGSAPHVTGFGVQIPATSWSFVDMAPDPGIYNIAFQLYTDGLSTLTLYNMRLFAMEMI